jgi:hypothetical protein
MIKNTIESAGFVFKYWPILFMAWGIGVVIFSLMRPDKYGEQGHVLGVALVGVGYAHLRINRLEAQKDPEDGGGEEGTASQQSSATSG